MDRMGNFELLRILAMIMIVAYPLGMNVGVHFYNEGLTIAHLWMAFLTIWGKVGVDFFVVLCGCFLISSRIERLYSFYK